MSCIVFYEKPGCATNQLQKQLLRSCGMKVKVLNLLIQPWTRRTLRPYFGEKPVAEWFNTSAPAIKYDNLDYRALDPEQAITLMLANPLLIRRPLIRFGEHRLAGFDLARLNAMLPCQGSFPIDSVDPLDGCSHGQESPVGCVPTTLEVTA